MFWSSFLISKNIRWDFDVKNEDDSVDRRCAWRSRKIVTNWNIWQFWFISFPMQRKTITRNWMMKKRLQNWNCRWFHRLKKPSMSLWGKMELSIGKSQIVLLKHCENSVHQALNKGPNLWFVFSWVTKFYNWQTAFWDIDEKTSGGDLRERNSDIEKRITICTIVYASHLVFNARKETRGIMRAHSSAICKLLNQFLISHARASVIWHATFFSIRSQFAFLTAF